MNTESYSLLAALRQWPIWLWFGRQDIRSRYRGSLLGPLWLVLNLGILVAALTIIYATIFDLAIEVYVPFVTTGFIAWWFAAGVLTESCNAFTSNAQVIRNMALPLGIHVLRVLARNTMLMAHNGIVYLVVAVAFHIKPTLATFYVVPGFALVASLLFMTGLSLAIICARYRDVPHIVASIVQLVIFVTPIVFPKDMLQRKTIVADINPFYHMVEAIRAPLLGNAPEPLTWMFLVGANVVTGFAACLLLRNTGHRVPYLV